MIFTELRFLLFFAVAFAVTWSLRGNTTRKAWLLACSYAFYAGWDWRFLALLWVSTGVDFAAGRLFAREPSPRVRRLGLAASLVSNLGILGLFKYYNFFVESAVDFTGWLGLPLPATTLEIVLPLGISFYTFQTLSYTIDVYRRRLAPTDSLLDFALFVAFFPQLVAGPIVRASEFLPQLTRARRFADVAVRAQLVLFLVGFVKKACVADGIAEVIDPVFADPAAYATATQWLASVLYSIQIYCDFSGYTDMALASAGLLGYELTENFRAPYLALGVRDFWRRWHISLSTWFRDYVYIPLGGDRVSSWRVARNLWAVFLLCGLWHGASWTFVLWGAWHGLFLVIERRVPAERLGAPLGHLYTLLVVVLGFVVFRSADLATAAVLLKGLLDPGAWTAAGEAVDPRWWLLVIAFAATHAWLAARPLEDRSAAVSDWIFAPAYGAAVALVLPWAAVGYQPFIYFQF